MCLRVSYDVDFAHTKKRKKKHISNIHTFAYQLDVSALDWRWRRRRLQSIYFLYMRTKRSVHARTFNAHRQYILSVLCVVVVVVKKAHTNTHTHEYKLTNEQWTIVCIKTFNEFIFIKGKFNAFALCVHTHARAQIRRMFPTSSHMPRVNSICVLCLHITNVRRGDAVRALICPNGHTINLSNLILKYKITM